MVLSDRQIMLNPLNMTEDPGWKIGDRDMEETRFHQ
jgi:hypothetical protein